MVRPLPPLTTIKTGQTVTVDGYDTPGTITSISAPIPSGTKTPLYWIGIRLHDQTRIMVAENKITTP